jgi:putative transposase
MRRARVTYQNAYHYIRNDGIEDLGIFLDDSSKAYFLKLLKEKIKKLKIRLLSYHIMDNHYCLVLQNCSGRLSDFMRELNSQYAINYRKKNSNKGYVFQGRYKSVLIEEGVYLQKTIIYTLLSPVRDKLVRNPYNYKWSSIKEYFNDKKDGLVDKEYAKKEFKSKTAFDALLEEWKTIDLPIKRTRFGALIGDENFQEKAIKKYDRRKNKRGESKRMRKGDYIFDTADNIIEDFEKKKGVKVKQIKINTKRGKELRAELLVMLKDKAGLRYKEIIDIPIFRPLKYSSLGQLYKRAKEKFSSA